MLHRILADAVLVAHLLFVVYAVLGGLLVLKYQFSVFLHLPVLIWAVAIEVSGRICPLTTIENNLRLEAGQSGYSTSFLEHYILPILYPTDLDRFDQILLAALLLAVNAVIYVLVLLNRRKKHIP